jgi:hypothetical protein
MRDAAFNVDDAPRTRSTSGGAVVKKTVLSVLLLSVFALTFQGKEVAHFKAVVVYLAGTAEKDVGSGWIRAFVEDELAVDSRIRTGEGTVLDLSTSVGSLRLLGDTEFELESLQKKEQSVKVTGGDILVKVKKLARGQSFTVDTPTVLAGVRGTQFWGRVNRQDESGTFAVREGSITLTRKRDGTTVTVRQGQAVDIDPGADDLVTRDALQAELDAMEQIDEMR